MNISQENSQKDGKQNMSNAVRYEQHILDTSSIGVLITQISGGTILYANKAIASLLGIADVDSLIGKPVPDFYWDPEDRKALLVRFRAEGFITNNETRARRADGSMIWVSITLQPFHLEDEQVLLSEISDITAQVQAQEALRAERDFNNALIEASPAFLVTISGDGKIRSMNQSMLQALGYTLEEVEGKDYLTTVVSEDERPALAGVFSHLTELRESTLNENNVLAKDGRLTLVEWHGRPILKASGEFDYFFGLGLDISERKQAEARLQSMVENAPEAIVVIDLTTGLFTEPNENAVKLYALSREELIKVGPVDMSPPVQPDGRLSAGKAKEQTNAAMQGASPVFEWMHRNARGEDVPCEVRLVRVPGNLPLVRASVTDITVRKQAEESQKKYQELFLSSRDGIAGISMEGNILECNAAFEAITGYTVAELQQMQFTDLTPKKWQAMENEILTTQVLTNGYAEPYQKEYIHKDGHIFPVELAVYLTRGADGKPTGFWGFIRDITERKQAEDESQRLASIVQNSSELVNLATLDGRMIFLNEAGSRMLGINPSEVGQHTLMEVIPEQWLGMVQTELLSTVMEKGRWEGDVQYRNIQTNAVTDVHTLAFVIKDAETGAPLYLANVSRDITESKRLEEEARVAALYARNLIEASLDPLVTINPDGKITDVNNATEQVTGVPRESLIGKEFADYFTEPDKAREGYQQVFSQGTVKDYPLTLRHVSGHTMEVLYNASVYKNEAGIVQGVFAAARDITESKRLEREVQEAFERRGYQVQVSTEISQEVASATELSDLFGRVVTLTKERLGYYHTQLLRYDTGQDAVVLINGYGETGQKMLAGGHKLPMGSGLIGTAAASGQTILRPALTEDPDWQPNPLLPETQGEIAVPIKLGEQVLGVLDVQSDQAGALTEDDRLLLEGLCGQVAVAIEQTRLRQEMAERLEEVNRLYRSMSREGWKTYRDTADLPTGFMFDQTGIQSVNEEILADELFAKIPMRVLGGEVVGTLTVANDPRHPTSSEDHAFLQQVSDQIALALESARLFEQTQSALAQTEKLFESSRSLTQATDLQQLVAVAVETFNIPVINRADLQIFNYNSADELDSTTIIANWWNGTGTEVVPIGTHFSKEMLPVIKLFLSPMPLFISDTLQDERMDAVTLEILKPMNVHAAAILPLTVGTHQLGVLILQAEETHDFTQDETRLFSGLAPQIATVLENRRQFERAQQQAEREGTLNIISQKIQGATTVEAVLQIAARELGHALGAPMTIAQLSMKDKK